MAKNVIWFKEQLFKKTGPKDIKTLASSIEHGREHVSTQDHNETLVGIHVVIGSVFALGLVASPWIVARNFRLAEQIPLAIVVFGTVLLVGALMFSTAIAMRRRKPIGRKLGLFAAGVLIFVFWPAAVYSWWFFHSDGAKKMYGVQKE